MMRGRHAAILLFRSRQRKNFFRFVDQVAQEIQQGILRKTTDSLVRWLVFDFRRLSS
jgi:uncharacterized protein with von Willebrand factor type A (vWA) domain